MIRKIRHRGLKRLYVKGDRRGLPADHVEDLEDILALLDAATHPGQLDLPGMDFHPLRGDRAGFFSVHVNGNWVVTFTFSGDDADQVDYEDYH
ncbi:type II toxin-antitoxin system RelE/ParE family toxin [Thioalkalivibrio sp. ALE12]|uniref:type II toxin-antitoxin system RelE/ParE family toxin n=1 Tax=Thioalkalivibrio sp. ALE12 TaxID=1158170 RepID=UPI0004764C00|nr:type II toxin-antitoxin system RelE/ParE family toxin [Thioalkalivibrio sp. ALE12]